MKKLRFWCKCLFFICLVAFICKTWNKMYLKNEEMTRLQLETAISEESVRLREIKQVDVGNTFRKIYSSIDAYAKQSVNDFKAFMKEDVLNHDFSKDVENVKEKLPLGNEEEDVPDDTSEDVLKPLETENMDSAENTFYTDDLELHFIDVGQGDCILLKYEDSAALIDAGNNDRGDEVAGYLTNEGIESLDMLFVTHPDADHCGGVDNIIDEMGSIETICMSACEKDTYTYEEMMYSVNLHGYEIRYPKKGDIFWLNNDVEITVMAPDYNEIGQSEDKNMYSLVLRVDYKDTSALLMGDAPVEIESMMLGEDISELRTDVLKLGHHGSYTSTSDDFLNIVCAKDGVVIMAEKGNPYSHPHGVIMDRLEDKKLPVYRTDTQGTVKCFMDGSSVSWNVDASNDYRDGDELLQ